MWGRLRWTGAGSALRMCAALAACAAFGCASFGSGSNYLTGYEALPETGFVNVVVEIPAGTNQKWEVAGDGHALEWEQEGGVGRVVRYLAYPANYGMVPRTRLAKDEGGDGDPVDVLVLGAAVERGSVILARPIGVLRLFDDGERDDKVIAVPTSGPFADVRDLRSLERQTPGVIQILETWLLHYKGPGRTALADLAGPRAAIELVREASRSFEQADSGDPPHRSDTASH